MFNMFNLLLDGTTTPPADDAAATGGTSLPMIIILCVLGVLILGMFIWSTISGKKKQREAQAMVDGIKIGDKVKTIGGICGYVAEINEEENSLVLETGLATNKSFVKIDKGAIYQTAPATVTAPIFEEKKTEPIAEKVEEEKTEETADKE